MKLLISASVSLQPLSKETFYVVVLSLTLFRYCKVILFGQIKKEDLAIIGAFSELFNAAYLVWNDIMDESSTRRGQPCWYRRDSVGMAAINDGCLIKSTIYDYHSQETFLWSSGILRPHGTPC
jgi:geranylgeranyl pyrophosphate synthase